MTISFNWKPFELKGIDFRFNQKCFALNEMTVSFNQMPFELNEIDFLLNSIYT